MSPSPGGWVCRCIDKWLTTPIDSTELVQRYQEADRLADLVRERIMLRLPLPDVLGYAKAWRREHGERLVRERLYALMNER